MKTVLITGASKGIGLATAKKFLDNGWQVIGTYLNTQSQLENPNLKMVKYDQSDSESISNLAKEVSKIMPQVDSLINNAGILIDGDDGVADPVKVKKTLEVNVIGVVGITEKLLPLFHEGSHIINIDSGYGLFSVPIDDEYAAGYRISKAALNMYTRHLAFRLKPRGIIVSSLAPGYVQTDMGYSIATEKVKPNRTPEEAGSDIFNLVMTVKETGQFWEFGEKLEW